MDFTAGKPVGRFNPKAPMVVIAPFAGLRPGDPVPKAQYAKLRRWWRRGWVANSHDLPDEVLAQIDRFLSSAPVEEVQAEQDVETPAEEHEEIVPLTAEEGSPGWWDVLFSDGSIKKMRRSQVEELGLVRDGV